MEQKNIYQTRYYYQNRSTGAPSANSLTIVQLCRILCPLVHVSSTKNTCLIESKTLLLGYNTSTRQYHDNGWIAANTINVLREACANWYYEGKDRKVMGPVSTRALASLFQKGKRKKSLKKEMNGDSDDDTVNENTRVWSGDINRSNETNSKCSNEWKCIGQLTHLRIALDAFHDDRSKTQIVAEAPTEPVEKLPIGEKLFGNSLDEEEAKELEMFLSSSGKDDEKSFDEEGFESDGGTYYVKNSTTGDWKPSKKRPRSPTTLSSMSKQEQQNRHSQKNNTDVLKKKSRKARFAAKNSKSWIYVTGLPLDTNEEEVAKFFSKVGILQLDPESQRPKIKLYRHKCVNDDGKRDSNGASNNKLNKNIEFGRLKGDASLCYARYESVELALQILDESLFRENKIHVTRARFQQHGDTFIDTARNKSMSLAKRRVARIAALQAVGWDDGENGRITGGFKGLRIIVLKGLFSLQEYLTKQISTGEKPSLPDNIIHELEKKLRTRCCEFGIVEKITIFAKNLEGVVIVKFAQPNAANDAIKALDGKFWENETRPVIATFWDGVTDYTVKENEDQRLKEEKKRHDDFGAWLENQDLPEEFKIQVEGS